MKKEKIKKKIMVAPKIKPKIVIGMDTGVNTGFAVWHRGEQKLLTVCTLSIHRAMEAILNLQRDYSGEIMVIWEDARKRRVSKELAADRNRLQGAGSIKRDGAIWEAFLSDYNIYNQAKAPNDKINSLVVTAPASKGIRYFQMLTKWKARTSEHSRVATMLCFGT